MQVGNRAAVVTKEEPNSFRKIVKVEVVGTVFRDQMNLAFRWC